MSTPSNLELKPSNDVSATSTEIDKPSVINNNKRNARFKGKPPKRRRLNNNNVKTFAENANKSERNLISADSFYTPIFINLKHLFELSKIVYSQMCARDHRLFNFCSLFLFQYVSYSLCFIKMLKMDRILGKHVPHYQELDQYLEDIQMPAPIVDFIDSIGIWTTPNGINVIPSLGDVYDRFCVQRSLQNVPISYVNPIPYMLLIPDMWSSWKDNIGELAICQPDEHEKAYGVHDRFGISSDLIERYITATPRMMKCGTLRTCSRLQEGTPALVVSSLSMGNSSGFVPQAPCILEDYYARRGVAYGFHDACEFDEWPKQNKSVLWPLCSGSVVNRSLVLAQYANSAIRS